MYVVNVVSKVYAVVALVLEHVIGSGEVKTTSKCCFYKPSPKVSGKLGLRKLSVANRMTTRRGRRPRHYG